MKIYLLNILLALIGQADTFDRYLPGADRFRELRTQRESGEPYATQRWRLAVSGDPIRLMFASDTEERVFVMIRVHQRFKDFYRVDLCDENGRIERFGYFECPNDMIPVTVTRIDSEALPEDLTHGVGVMEPDSLHHVNESSFTTSRPFPIAPEVMVVPIDWHDREGERSMNSQYRGDVLNNLDDLVIQPLDFFGVDHTPPAHRVLDPDALNHPELITFLQQVEQDPRGLRFTLIGHAVDEADGDSKVPPLELDFYASAERWSVADKYGTRTEWLEPVEEDWILVRKIYRGGLRRPGLDVWANLQYQDFWSEADPGSTESFQSGLTVFLRHRSEVGVEIQVTRRFATYEDAQSAIFKMVQGQTWWNGKEANLLSLLDRIQPSSETDQN